MYPGSDPSTTRHRGLTPFLAVSASAQSPVSVGARQLVMPFENATHEPRFSWLAAPSTLDDAARSALQTVPTREPSNAAARQLLDRLPAR